MALAKDGEDDFNVTGERETDSIADLEKSLFLLQSQAVREPTCTS